MSNNQLERRSVHVRPVSDALISWDSIPMCNPDTCFLGKTCDSVLEGCCPLHVKYQDHVIRSLLEDVEEPTAEQLLIIGMHLVPLYSQLLSFKMYTRNAPAVLIDEENGMPKANPIYSAIQSLLRSITSQHMQLKKLGLVKEPLHEENIKAMQQAKTIAAKGDPGYFEQLMEQKA